MICYLVRHGKDDDTVRGGWSDSPLTKEGIEQVKKLATNLQTVGNLSISTIYTSDLPRARQTADILAEALKVSVVEMPAFRETNNGVLAGMNNQEANMRYPGLFWGALDWDQAYPGGESPADFYNRIFVAWEDFKKQIRDARENVILVTHGGVINVIRCIENEIPYSNKVNPFPVENAGMVAIEI